MHTSDRTSFLTPIRIGAALLKPDATLEKLLDQIGVSWRILPEEVMSMSELEALGDGLAANGAFPARTAIPSCVILNAPLGARERHFWMERVRRGDTTILDLDPNLFGHPLSTRKIGLDKDPDEEWLGDLADLPWGPLNCLSTPVAIHAEGTLFFHPEHPYAWCGWPFALAASAPLHRHASYPGAGASTGRWSRNPDPSERIASAPWGVLRHLLEDILIQLHARAGIPFVHRSTAPAGADRVLLFRVDSDGGGPRETAALFDLLDRHEIRSTWFLHVSAHEGWLSDFDRRKGHEMALHCYRHSVHPDRPSLEADLRRGLKALGTHLPSHRIRGAAAPFGLYAAHYAELLADPSFHRFDYSSEFSFDVDNLPHRPFPPGSPLQIPVHPICPGSFRRTDADDGSVTAYFTARARLTAYRRDPLVFYHHPMQNDRGALDGLFRCIRGMEGTTACMTFGEWHDWWTARNRFDLNAWFDPAAGRVSVSVGGDIASDPKGAGSVAGAVEHDVTVALDRNRHFRTGVGQWSLDELEGRVSERRKSYLLDGMDRAFRVNRSHRQRFHHMRSDLLDRLGRSLQ